MEELPPINITDAYGNRWDHDEWLAMGQSEQAWDTIVALTRKVALLESAIRKVDDGYAYDEMIEIVGRYIEADSPEGKLWQAIITPPALP